jgi:predicted MFS family arabinose efflux permease
MGAIMAILTVAHSAGMLAGSLLGGVMMDWYHLELAFYVGAAVMLAGLVLFLGLLVGKQMGTEISGAPLSAEPPPVEEGPPVG